MIQCAKNRKKSWKSAKKLKNLQINHQIDKIRIYRKKTLKIKTKTPIFFCGKQLQAKNSKRHFKQILRAALRRMKWIVHKYFLEKGWNPYFF